MATRHWEMTVDLSVIENLGLKMYVTIPPVISELIAMHAFI